MAEWFTSDQHFGHRNIIEYSKRPFSSLQEMHETLIARHNQTVAADDFVWHLGDFALDDRIIPDILPRLNGKHFLVVGNHDKCHPCHKRSEHYKRKYLLYGFSQVYREVQLYPFLMNHLPYAGDSGHEARFPKWRPVDRGWWLLHGHVHEAWKVRDKMINVGVDVWDYRPVALKELLKLAKSDESRILPCERPK